MRQSADAAVPRPQGQAGDAAQLGDAPAHVPDIAHFNLGQQLVDLGRRQAGQVAHAGELGLLLRDVVGQLGQRLGGTDTDADGHADPAQDVVPDGLAHVAHARPVAGQAIQGEEALINGVDLQARAVLAQHVGDAVAHVRIEGVVGGQGHDAVLAGQVLHHEPGRGHLDAQRLGLVGARHGAAVIVGQHHHRPREQLGIEDPLAGHVEIIDVDQSETGRAERLGAHSIFLATPTTTPKTSSTSPSPKRIGRKSGFSGWSS